STHYQTLARTDELGNIVALEAARMAADCRSLDPQTFEREREVVRNEIRQRQGTAEQLVVYRVLEATYPDGHAYHRHIGRDDAPLPAIKIGAVCAFMDAYYVPERATVIIAGDAGDQSAVAALAGRSFGAVPPRHGKPLAAVGALAVQKKTVTIEADVDET